MGWRSKMRKVKCSNGDVMFVYRDAEDAFPVLAPKATGSLDVAVAALTEVEARVSAGYQREVKDLGSRIDSINLSMREALRAAYVVFQGNPCSDHGNLAAHVRSITGFEQQLRSFALSIEQCARFLESGVAADEVMPILRDRLRSIERSSSEIPALTELAMEQRLNEWENGE